MQKVRGSNPLSSTIFRMPIRGKSAKLLALDRDLTWANAELRTAALYAECQGPNLSGPPVKHAQHPNDPDSRSDGAILDALRTAGVPRPNFRPDEVQAKRWSHSVPGRIVRELRGAPRVDERGLIVTTAEFTPEAIREAAAEGKARIGLLGGDTLVRTCAERGIGVDRRQAVVLEPIPGDLRLQ